MIGIHIRKTIQAKKKTVSYIEKYDVKSSKTMTNALHRYKQNFESNTIQIYTHGPMNRNRNNINSERFNKEAKDMNVYIHSSHTTSWKEDTDSDSKSVNTKHAIDQFNTAAEFNAIGIVIHFPKAEPEYIIDRLKIWLPLIPDGLKILLEVRSIRPGPMSYETPEKLLDMISRIEEIDGYSSDNCGIVLDTAHLYVGYAPMRDYDDVIEFLDKLEDKKEWFPLLHFNGNYIDADKKAGDIHITPFSRGDKIWGDKDTDLETRLIDSWDDSGALAYVETYLKWGSDVVLELDHHTESARTFLSFLLAYTPFGKEV